MPAWLISGGLKVGAGARPAGDWLNSRGLVKRRTRESDESNWRNYVRPHFGNWPVAAITAAEVSAWVSGLIARGLAPATATRALATLRSIRAARS